MPRLSTSNPKYRKHTSGRAVVTIDGKDIYLGTHGTKTSKVEYDRVIAEYLAAGRRLLTAAHEPTVSEIALAFWKHAMAYYRKPVLNADGSQKLDAAGKAVTEPTTEVRNLKRVLRPFRKLYGHTLARKFGPLSLKAFRQHMIQLGRCRTRSSRPRCPSCRATSGQWSSCSCGRGCVRASCARCARATLTRGATSGRIAHCSTRTLTMDTSASCCSAPGAQAILRPFLKTDLSAFIFSPKEAEEERRQSLHARRRTPLSCGNVPGSNRAPRAKRVLGDQYTAESYRRAVARGCDVPVRPTS
jgi:hypothetical protein